MGKTGNTSQFVVVDFSSMFFVGLWCSLLKYPVQKPIYGAAVSTLHQICCFFFSLYGKDNLMGNIY